MSASPKPVAAHHDDAILQFSASRKWIIASSVMLGTVLEVLDSLNLLTAARQDLVRAMAGYSQSQFELYVALGNAPDGSRRVSVSHR